MKKIKEKILKQAQLHVGSIIQKIHAKLEMIKEVADLSVKELSKMSPADQVIFMNLRENANRRIVELNHLAGSPYFMRCKIVDEKNKTKEYFFAKHEFYEESVYSWVAPISTIRFEKPGMVSYKVQNGNTRKILLREKEIYTIVNGKILLLTQEKEGKDQELIFQENFSRHKTDFVLPEIVAEMEKTQDQVIRASYEGPLVISGPAGSGKTTLALHRIAYLTQIPDTEKLFPSSSIIIFVQDNRTQNYFSSLLPSLGISNVKITTFSEWSFNVLGLKRYHFSDIVGKSREEQEVYEYEKRKIIKTNSIPKWNSDAFYVLRNTYANRLSIDNFNIFLQQERENKLDRFDLVILLKSYLLQNKKFEIKKKSKLVVKGKMVERKEIIPIIYSLMVIDEFQNYLPEQIQILKECIDEKTKSVVYVGDMSQQVKLGTIKKWEEINETIVPDRNIKLNKVYRNTKNILSYIRYIGFDVVLPDGLKEGPSVVEKVINTTEAEIEYINEILIKHPDEIIGILAKEKNYLLCFEKEFINKKNVHILSMLEAQGVEFDIVFIVGIDKSIFTISKDIDCSFTYIEEKKRINKDLLYVALTRAITEMHILGREKLSTIMKK